MGEVVVRQIFQLELVGRAFQPGGVGGRDHRVGQLPDLAHRVLEGAVAVDHDLHGLSGFFPKALLDLVHQRPAVPGEQLDLVLGGLVGAQQAVVRVEAAAVHRGGHDLVQAEHPPGAGGSQQAAGAGAGMDVTMQHILGVVQNGAAVVGKDDLRLGAALPDEAFVIFHIVHAGEGMLFIAEQLPVPLQGQHIAVGVDALFVQRVQAHQVVAHLVRGIAQHQHHLFGAPGDAPQADGEAVAAEDGENDAHRPAAQLGADIPGDVVHSGIVALGTGHDGLGHGDDVAVANGKAVLRGGLQHGIGDDLGQIIAAADDGRADAPGNSTDHTAHIENTP